MMLYSVIRLVPDPYAGEQINIGLILVDCQERQPPIVLRTDEWDRVRSFARRKDLSDIMNFVDSLDEQIRELWNTSPQAVESTLQFWAREWWGLFRISEPRPIDLAPDVAQRYVQETFLQGNRVAMA